MATTKKSTPKKQASLIIIDDPLVNVPTPEQIEAMETPKNEVREPEPELLEEEIQVEEILAKAIIKDCPGARVFSIIRDVLSKEFDPQVFDEVLEDWVHKNYYIVMPPYSTIRDGYLTELGRLYMKNTYKLW